MSSVGLRVLMLAVKQCNKEGGEVVICGLQSIMVEIFEISRFDKIFKVFDSTLDALRAFDPDSAQAYLAEQQ